MKTEEFLLPLDSTTEQVGKLITTIETKLSNIDEEIADLEFHLESEQSKLNVWNVAVAQQERTKSLIQMELGTLPDFSKELEKRQLEVEDTTTDMENALENLILYKGKLEQMTTHLVNVEKTLESVDFSILNDHLSIDLLE